MAAVAIESLVLVPAFAGIVTLGAHLHEREVTRSELAAEARHDVWGSARGQCRVPAGAATIDPGGVTSFAVGLEAAIAQAGLEPHLAPRDVARRTRRAVLSRTRDLARPLLLGSGTTRVSSALGIACDVETRIRTFQKELHDVYDFFRFLIAW